MAHVAEAAEAEEWFAIGSAPWLPMARDGISRHKPPNVGAMGAAGAAARCAEMAAAAPAAEGMCAANKGDLATADC